MDNEAENDLLRAAEILARSERLLVFTGAGVSKESGVPTFRGEGGLWDHIDPGVLELSRFRREPEECWRAIRTLFYSASPPPRPNAAHRVLARWEEEGRVAFLVTQNIDGLHREAGSKRVAEFHGSLANLVCMRCGARQAATHEAVAAGLLAELPPRCGDCGGILKPDFVFFGEGIPPDVYAAAFAEAERADACLIVGSTGVVYPAAQIPIVVKQKGGAIVEIDPSVTEFTNSLSDAHVPLGAVEAMTRLDALLRARSA